MSCYGCKKRNVTSTYNCHNDCKEYAMELEALANKKAQKEEYVQKHSTYRGHGNCPSYRTRMFAKV